MHVHTCRVHTAWLPIARACNIGLLKAHAHHAGIETTGAWRCMQAARPLVSLYQPTSPHPGRAIQMASRCPGQDTDAALHHLRWALLQQDHRQGFRGHRSRSLHTVPSYPRACTLARMHAGAQDSHMACSHTGQRQRRAWHSRQLHTSNPGGPSTRNSQHPLSGGQQQQQLQHNCCTPGC